jgi:hypothetical protein
MKPVSTTEDGECLNVKFEMRPDPERYDEIEFEGRPAFLDKFTQTVIPWDTFAGSVTNFL